MTLGAWNDQSPEKSSCTKYKQKTPVTYVGHPGLVCSAINDVISHRSGQGS